MFENQKKIENIEIKDILQKSPSKRSFRHRMHSFPRRADLPYLTHIAGLRVRYSY